MSVFRLFFVTCLFKYYHVEQMQNYFQAVLVTTFSKLKTEFETLPEITKF